MFRQSLCFGYSIISTAPRTSALQTPNGPCSIHNISDKKLTITRPRDLRIWLTQAKLYTLPLGRLCGTRIPRRRSTPISPQIVGRDHRTGFPMRLHHGRKTSIICNGPSSIRQMLMGLGDVVGPHLGSISSLVGGCRHARSGTKWQSRVRVLQVVVHDFMVEEIAGSGQRGDWGRLIA